MWIFERVVFLSMCNEANFVNTSIKSINPFLFRNVSVSPVTKFTGSVCSYVSFFIPKDVDCCFSVINRGVLALLIFSPCSIRSGFFLSCFIDFFLHPVSCSSFFRCDQCCFPNSWSWAPRWLTLMLPIFLLSLTLACI